MTWTPQQLSPEHPPVRSGNIGVLLVNLGTPDAPTAKAVKKYLAEFLSDKRVIEIPSIVWQPILRGIILNNRPKKSAHAYSQVWGKYGSPLATLTAEQAEALQMRLGDQVQVGWGMRYGNPSIEQELTRLKDAGCDRILLAPMYPQYCGATTATVVDKASEVLGKMRWQPTLRTMPPYHDDPAYITALAQDLTRQLDDLTFEPEVLLLSFHGMPERTLPKGDPYHCHCQKTARLLEAEIRASGKRSEMRVLTTFQSRFGRAKWLEPATDTTLMAEGKAGTKRMAIAAPGFAVDCLETLEELAIQGREQFTEAGGEEFAALSCLNSSDAGMVMLETIIRRELSGWI